MCFTGILISSYSDVVMGENNAKYRTMTIEIIPLLVVTKLWISVF